MSDPRRPVIVGIADAKVDSQNPIDPFHWLADVVRTAFDDAGAARAVGNIDHLALVDVAAWKVHAPATHLARLVGATPRTALVSATGGNAGQSLLNAACDAVQAGESDIAVLAGVERLGARILAGHTGTWLDWDAGAAEDEPNPVYGSQRAGTAPDEEAAGALMPLDIYPLFETARRHRLGLSVEDHAHELALLISKFSHVAATQDAAWHPTALSPAEVQTVTASNRMVAAPYRRSMVADIRVDQAAAVVVMSSERADALGIPADRRVCPLAGAEGVETFWFSRRAALDRSPALDAVAQEVLNATSDALARPVTGDDIARFDLYSCFPIAVFLGASAFGINDAVAESRPLTLTGGLARFGGPASNYSTHGIVASVRACRNNPGELGVATALGWYATKHAAGTFCSIPGDHPYRTVRLSPRPESEVEVLTAANSGAQLTVTGTVEGSAVEFQRDGTISKTVVAARTREGGRFLASSADAALGLQCATEAAEGRSITATVQGDHFAIADLT